MKEIQRLTGMTVKWNKGWHWKNIFWIARNIFFKIWVIHYLVSLLNENYLQCTRSGKLLNRSWNLITCIWNTTRLIVSETPWSGHWVYWKWVTSRDMFNWKRQIKSVKVCDEIWMLNLSKLKGCSIGIEEVNWGAFIDVMHGYFKRLS